MLPVALEILFVNSPKACPMSGARKAFGKHFHGLSDVLCPLFQTN